MLKRKITLALLFILVTAACQGGRGTPDPISPASSPADSETLNTATPALTQSATPEGQASEPIPNPSNTAYPEPMRNPLDPFTIDWDQPFGGQMMTGEAITLDGWTPDAYAGQEISLPITLAQVENLEVLEYLTADQKAFLETNGFVVIHSQEDQFGDIRVETARRTGQPYYLTTDAAFHALHLLFDDLLKSLEREHFRSQMMAITKATLEEVRANTFEAQGTALETEAQQALAYLSVALKLFDPQTEVDPAVANLVSDQVAQILAADGRDDSVLFPGFEDDYGAYKPVGHYAGDPDLEAYFRGMTWYGRMHFLLGEPSNPNFKPSRLPLIVTLALRRSKVDDLPASAAWADLHRVLTFMVGPSDDMGPLEYGELMDQVYGSSPGIQDLADQALWEEFQARSEQFPEPQINSLFVISMDDSIPEVGWRFMGQRFTLDGMIFQNLIFDKLHAKPDNTRRELPSGLDVMSVFGSEPASQELEAQGVTTFPNYAEQMEKLEQAVAAQPEAQWLGRFYDAWLYAFFPVVQAKDSAYPASMQTPAWGYKDLNTALGSWAELKHDTVLYTKMPEMLAGGGPPMSKPAPSYVEPNPEAFYRMSYMARMLSCGLQNLVLEHPCSPGWGVSYPDTAGFIYGMGELGERLSRLGDMAAKELAGQPLDEGENASITGCLGMIACLNKKSDYNQPAGEMPKVPVIAAVSGAEERVLEVGIGKVDRIFVVVPLEGKWEIAQGGVFSYYEFDQPRNQRLTDDEWREMLDLGEVEMPVWASNFVLMGGLPKEVLFFRVGDIYIISKAGDALNLREGPSLESSVVVQLESDAYVEIVDGPVLADGYTWWKVTLFNWGSDTITSGWVVEDQQWYQRSYIP